MDPMTVVTQHKEQMLAMYPERAELTRVLLPQISELLREDFNTISNRKKRLRITFSYIAEILRQACEQGVKKKYALALVDVLLDTQVTAVLKEKLKEEAGTYIATMEAVRSELVHSQWSDPTSRHWQQVFSKLQ